MIAVAVTAALVALRAGLKSQTAKKVVGTMFRGAIVGAARALPRLVLRKVAEKALGK